MSDDADNGHVIRRVPATAIVKDGELQPRAQLYGNLVREYAVAYEAGAKFPPVVVFEVDGKLLLADGFHRLQAQMRNGTQAVEVDVRQGTRRDAICFSRVHNAMHGARYTTTDKQRAIQTFLEDDEWSLLPDREIARMLGTDHKTVGKYRRDMLGITQKQKVAALAAPKETMASLKAKVAELEEEIRRLRADADGSLFDLKNDTPESIGKVLAHTVSESKARKICKVALDAVNEIAKRRKAHAG